MTPFLAKTGFFVAHPLSMLFGLCGGDTLYNTRRPREFHTYENGVHIIYSFRCLFIHELFYFQFEFIFDLLTSNQIDRAKSRFETSHRAISLSVKIEIYLRVLNCHKLWKEKRLIVDCIHWAFPKEPNGQHLLYAAFLG
jgi:hypothetical protein